MICGVFWADTFSRLQRLILHYILLLNCTLLYSKYGCKWGLHELLTTSRNEQMWLDCIRGKDSHAAEFILTATKDHLLYMDVINLEKHTKTRYWCFDELYKNTGIATKKIFFPATYIFYSFPSQTILNGITYCRFVHSIVLLNLNEQSHKTNVEHDDLSENEALWHFWTPVNTAYLTCVQLGLELHRFLTK